MLFEMPIKNLVINGSSAPAFINWPTTWGNTNAKSEIIWTWNAKKGWGKSKGINKIDSKIEKR